MGVVNWTGRGGGEELVWHCGSGSQPVTTPRRVVVLAFREKDEWLLNWKREREKERRGFVRSAELLSPPPRARTTAAAVIKL